MRNASISLFVILAGCAPQTLPPGVTNADVARCNYEAEAAVASAPSRTAGDAFAAGMRQGNLQRLCLQSVSATALAAMPTYRCNTVFNRKTGEYDCTGEAMIVQQGAK
jgi:hypothetical protein